MTTRNDENVPSKLRLYVQLGFGALVLFGMVGNLAGYRQGGVLVMVMTAICWSLTKIVVEAVDAWRLLHPSDKDSDPPPPAAAT